MGTDPGLAGRKTRVLFFFKAISTRVANGEGRAENTLWRVGSDYTYRDLGELLQMLGSAPPGVPRVRTARLPEDTRPGFLFAVAELVWARVPVFIEYQPKWWFKAEGVLDETEVFP